MATTAHPVVIGVDGSTGSTNALRHGLAEARRLGVVARLVHVVPSDVPMSPLPQEVARETGLSILRAAETSTDALAAGSAGSGQSAGSAGSAGVAVETRMVSGSRQRELLRAAEDAQLLVVGRDARPLLERLVRGNTTAGVAARASLPVVCVPEEWRPAATGTVVVGVRSAERQDGLIGAAFELAAQRDARLVLVHAWSLPEEYDDVVTDRVAGREWAERSTREIEERLGEWRARHPGVSATVRVVHGRTAQVLAEASREADELVLARRRHGVLGAHLGSTARSLLRTSACPVRIVDGAEASTQRRQVDAATGARR